MGSYEARCHCGALGYIYTTSLEPATWSVRSCQCGFCSAHGARCTSDPAGSVSFDFAATDALRRYRFGLRTADFLVCRRCGVYLGAVIADGDKSYATLNVNALKPAPPELPPTQPAVYDGEGIEERVGRRCSRWTPVRA